MISTAFVAASPRVTPLASTTLSASSFTTRTRPATPAIVARRTPTIVMYEREEIPQGFTPFSEQLNGRAAMIGFALAVVTELITGKGVLGQLASITQVAHAVLPF